MLYLVRAKLNQQYSSSLTPFGSATQLTWYAVSSTYNAERSLKYPRDHGYSKLINFSRRHLIIASYWTKTGKLVLARTDFPHGLEVCEVYTWSWKGYTIIDGTLAQVRETCQYMLPPVFSKPAIGRISRVGDQEGMANVRRNSSFGLLFKLTKQSR